MAICTCSSAIGNLGLPGCEPEIGIIKRMILVSLYKEDGSLNFVDTTATLNAAYFNALQYNTDTYQRWYPFAKDLKNVETPKADPVYREFNDGSKEYVRDGVRQFMALVPNGFPKIVGKIKASGCRKLGVYFVDDRGNLVGYEKSTGKLYPLELSMNTLNAFWSYATDSQNQQVNIAFEFDSKLEDEKISYIESTDIGIDLLREFNGKMDANLSQVGTGTTTGFSAKLTLDYGNTKNKLAVSGLVAGDFVLHNVTDSAAVTISTVTESPDGTYAFTFTGQTNTDILRLSLGTTTPAKPFDDATWSSVSITLQ
jgi:hypothetical protein